MIAVAVVAVLLSQNEYNRSKVRPPSDHCLYWAHTTVKWQANSAGNPETPGDTEFDALRASFDEWNSQLSLCGNLIFQEGPRTESRTVGWLRLASEIDKNQNILVFRQKSCADLGIPLTDDCWDAEDTQTCGNKYDCWEHQRAAIALTTTTYDPQSGRILDADIELNQPSFIFSTVDAPPCISPAYSTSCVAWDLQNTVTHEIGHMMGLDHTTFAGSTMNPTAPPGELSKRSLDDGTRNFVCAVYPKGSVARDCVIRPVTGELGGVANGCGCGTGAGLLVLPALALALRRRRSS